MDCADCCLQESSAPPHSLRSDLLTQKGVSFLPVSIEEVIEKESEKSLSIINWKTLRGF
jgi:hypothetical protein